MSGENAIGDVARLDEKRLDEKRLDEMERQISDLEKSLETVENVAGDKTIVKSGTSKSTMKISGRIHLDAWGFDDKDASIASFENPSNPIRYLWGPVRRRLLRRQKSAAINPCSDSRTNNLTMSIGFASPRSSMIRFRRFSIVLVVQ